MLSFQNIRFELLEVSAKEALERTSVASFVLRHLVYGVVDGVFSFFLEMT